MEPRLSGLISPILPRYKYEPLPTTSSFRYFELLPGTGNDKIRVRLHLADWNDSPLYDAISYAWGEPEDKVPIMVRAGVIKIPRNLLHGLKHLRLPKRSRFLWADAICINQKHVKERNHQVDNMRQIFGNAAQVVVWLGQDRRGSAATAFEALEEIARGCPSEIPLRDVANLLDCVPETVCPKLESYVLRRMIELKELLNRAWFTRLWVVQEVNATVNVQVQWGDGLISWHVLTMANAYMSKHWHRFSQILDEREQVMDNISYMRAYHRHRNYTILDTLHRGRDFHCADPRDHVYGLLGMPVSHGGYDIAADYSKSTLELFRDIVRLTLENRKSLDFLSYVQHQAADLDVFPSWIPRWDERLLFDPVLHKDFDASRGKDLQYTLDVSTHRLVLKGVCLDAIVEREDYDWLSYHMTATPHFLGHPLLKCLQINETKVGSDRIPINGSLLNMGLILCGADLNGQVVDSDSEILSPCLTDYLQYLTQNSQHAGSSTKTWMDLTADARTYENAVAWTMINRCLFTTTHGYRGCGTIILQPGDKICILFGGCMLYILRPVEGHYKFIGEAYIPEFMRGRAIDMLDAGELQEEVFELR